MSAKKEGPADAENTTLQMHKDDLEGAEFSSKYQTLLGAAHDRVKY